MPAQTGWVLVFLGAAMALLAVLANPLGIGHSGFGWHQVVLLVVGIMVAVVGAVLVVRPHDSGVSPGGGQ
jgi:threonine/homoserine efflux transporter RhtA